MDGVEFGGSVGGCRVGSMGGGCRWLQKGHPGLWMKLGERVSGSRGSTTSGVWSVTNGLMWQRWR